MNRVATLIVYALFGSAVNLGAGQPPTRPERPPAIRTYPAEFTGPPKAIPPKPSPVLIRFVQNEAIQKANKEDPQSFRRALETIDAFVTEAPNEPLIRFMRAVLQCEAGAEPQRVLDDLTTAQANLTTPQAREIVPVKSVLQLKSKMEFRLGQHEAALRDLDAAIREDYDDAMSVFNGGEVDPSLVTKSCAWTMPDLELLATRFPDDHRPTLYEGLYTAFFLRLKPDADHTLVIEAYERAAKLNPKSPLPYYYLGTLHAFGSIGGLFSTTNASCIEDIAAESEACQQLTQVRRKALRYFTNAIAVGPDFEPAYSSRAALLLRLKEYRQAIRDYDRALLLKPGKNETRIIYNDRALAKMQLGDYSSAILDLNRSVAIGCETSCNSYGNRAEAHLKVGNYTAALADVATSIRLVMSNSIYLMNIDTFRKLYPEYDDVADDVICEKMRALFFPQESYEQFAQHFLIGEVKLEPTFILSDFYLKRGDIYAKLGRTKLADAEYDRMQRVFPTFYEIAFKAENGKRVRVKD